MSQQFIPKCCFCKHTDESLAAPTLEEAMHKADCAEWYVLIDHRDKVSFGCPKCCPLNLNRGQK